MKNFILRSLGFALTLAAAMPTYAGIYLIYGKGSGNPVAVIDDQTDADVLEEGYLSPRAHAWTGYAFGAVAVPSAAVIPRAFVPPNYAIGGSFLMPSVILTAPTATSSPQLSRVIQSGHAWSAYQAGNNATGLGLVYSPSYGGYVSPSQRSARGNRARAQAFRLDYYK
jgi:hypothetical protein